MYFIIEVHCTKNFMPYSTKRTAKAGVLLCATLAKEQCDHCLCPFASAGLGAVAQLLLLLGF